MLLWRGDVLYNTVAGNIFWVWVQILLQQNSKIHLVKMLDHVTWAQVGRHDAVLFVPEAHRVVGLALRERISRRSASGHLGEPHLSSWEWSKSSQDLYVRAMPIFVTSPFLTAIILCPERASRIKMHYFAAWTHAKPSERHQTAPPKARSLYIVHVNKKTMHII